MVRARPLTIRNGFQGVPEPDAPPVLARERAMVSGNYLIIFHKSVMENFDILKIFWPD